jgi:hypothetical protein
MLLHFPEAARDPLWALTAAFNADTRPFKLDLGLGVHRDENGAAPVLDAVRVVEEPALDTEAPSVLSIVRQARIVQPKSFANARHAPVEAFSCNRMIGRIFHQEAHDDGFHAAFLLFAASFDRTCLQGHVMLPVTWRNVSWIMQNLPDLPRAPFIWAMTRCSTRVR